MPGFFLPKFRAKKHVISSDHASYSAAVLHIFHQENASCTEGVLHKINDGFFANYVVFFCLEGDVFVGQVGQVGQVGKKMMFL